VLFEDDSFPFFPVLLEEELALVSIKPLADKEELFTMKSGMKVFWPGFGIGFTLVEFGLF